MDRARFEELLAAYGADFRRWPSDERAAAEVFAKANAETLASALGDARTLDQVLELVAEPAAPSVALSDRILEAAPMARTSTRPREFTAAGWALAACALLGVLIGYGGGALAAPSAAQDDYFAAAFEAPVDISDTGDAG